tara:strand:+ start:139 stop:537 length:399 start_codon:yes stop_codon:yes gene_type:complete
MTASKVQRLDYTAIFLSVLCAIHCTVLPLLIPLMPFLGGIFEGEWFHITLLVIIVPMAGFTFYRCYKLHGDKNVLYLGALAMSLLVAGILVEPYSEVLEKVFSIGGSLTAIAAHIKNIRHCRCLTQSGQCAH